ncbi:uncharacterized protein DS421_10g292110 [Arachis hypogaea]|nr:uncharacterized protein DS421_10g292110 [Arachis hypogaea]
MMVQFQAGNLVQIGEFAFDACMLSSVRKYRRKYTYLSLISYNCVPCPPPPPWLFRLSPLEIAVVLGIEFQFNFNCNGGFGNTSGSRKRSGSCRRWRIQRTKCR